MREFCITLLTRTILFHMRYICTQLVIISLYSDDSFILCALYTNDSFIFTQFTQFIYYSLHNLYTIYAIYLFSHDAIIFFLVCQLHMTNNFFFCIILCDIYVIPLCSQLIPLLLPDPNDSY